MYLYIYLYICLYYIITGYLYIYLCMYIEYLLLETLVECLEFYDLGAQKSGNMS